MVEWCWSNATSHFWVKQFWHEDGNSSHKIQNADVYDRSKRKAVPLV